MCRSKHAHITRLSLTTSMSKSSKSHHPHTLRRDVRIYATGCVLNEEQMTAISRAVCDDAFCKKNPGGPVFALKWFIGRYRYELLPIDNGNDSMPHLFAISFFPYLKDATSSDALFSRLSSPSEEEKKMWFERFGQHTGIKLEDLEMYTMLYPTFGAIESFVISQVQQVINSREELWHFLVPLPSRSAATSKTAI
ncbi:hypothetical protein C8R45DRAFT_1025920 [Mycena sanguinolenta]|nr:hypothetical protein C8R45DRAFT_1025920 [Mycena sanguinolenta]